jgi:hypothetical protein
MKWDVLEIFEFTSEGKIFSIRDYFDCSETYDFIRERFGDEALKTIKKMTTHSLDPTFDPQARPYSQLQF